jgi:hypothetical protein
MWIDLLTAAGDDLDVDDEDTAEYPEMKQDPVYSMDTKVGIHTYTYIYWLPS